MNKPKTHVNVFLVDAASGHHGRHAVPAKTVSQHGRHHRVPVRDVLPAALRQSHDHLQTHRTEP